MKVPAPPPDYRDIAKEFLTSGDSYFLLETRAGVEPLTDPYLPWDKLRYKEPPFELTVEEWWVATKIARRSIARRIESLLGGDGRPFTYALPDEVLREVDYINRNASGQITIDEKVTNPATRDRYLVRSLIEEAITSSQLEGAATSRRVAKEMIRTGRPPRDKSERMILNNYRAMERIVELRHEPLTPALIMEIHRMVTAGTLDDPASAGTVQWNQADRVSVWGDSDQLLHRPPPVDELPHRMEVLCDFANDTEETAYLPGAVRAVIVHFMMGYDYYFEDGNGRTARAVFYWSMLNQGYWLTEFLTISRILKAAPARYARSFLLTEQDEGDLTYFLQYNLGVIHRAIEDLHAYLADKAESLRAVQTAIRATPGEFNHRQLAVLEAALRDETTEFTTHSHSASHGTTVETARQDLMGLERRGLLRHERRGRRYRWVATADLADKLSQ